MIELVAFDMAGTTIDDHGLVYRALADSVVETGATLEPEDLQKWMGTDKATAIEALARIGGRALSPSAVAVAFSRFREILEQSYRDEPPVALPGVADTLAALRDRGVKVALTTGFSDEVAYPMLDTIGWRVGEQLDAVVTTSDVTFGRPAPYLIHHAMEKIGVADVELVLAAGDTVVDLLAAKNAGVLGVGVLTGALSRHELEQHPHHYILNSVADVLALDELA